MLGTGWQWEKTWESWGQQNLPTPLVTSACRAQGPFACRDSHKLHVILYACFSAQGAGPISDACTGVSGERKDEWAVMDLEEMMPEQSQTAAMGKRSQSSAWKGSKQLLM